MDLATLNFAEQVNFTVDLTTAVSVTLGTPITHSITVNPVSTDETPLDNVIIYNDSVVGSYDPNDKLLSPAVLAPAQVQVGEYHRIRHPLPEYRHLPSRTRSDLGHAFRRPAMGKHALHRQQSPEPLVRY